MSNIKEQLQLVFEEQVSLDEVIRKPEDDKAVAKKLKPELEKVLVWKACLI